MDEVDGVNVDACLEAQQSGIALRIGVGEVAFLDFLVQPMGEDIVVDEVGEERHLS